MRKPGASSSAPAKIDSVGADARSQNRFEPHRPQKPLR